MNEHALQVLQFDEALAVVAGHASSPLGAEAVRALRPSDTRAWVDEELRRVDQMLGALLRAPDWTVPTIPDLRSALRRLALDGGMLHGFELRDIGEMARSAHDIRRVLAVHAEHFPLVFAVADRLGKFEAEERTIRRAIDGAGDVRDEASPTLTRLRREIRGERSRIVAKLEAYMGSLSSRYQVPDASVSVRDGRYVVPVRREARAEVGGIVHDESATGQTLFVEPPVAIELMNRLREMERAEVREVQRVLRELSDGIRPRRDDIAATFEAMVEIDSLFGRARYALHTNGRRPAVAATGEWRLRIVDGRHPLLLAGGQPVVPFDLDMEEGERTILVSGPNTGGKTVLLKAVGLLAALSQSGVIPPVGESTMVPLFQLFFADIGDEQSIEASLSTFSAHLKNLKQIIEHADDRSLVLIDEIGSGTDPAEGGALAEAILLELTERGAMTMATTHLGQLKQLATSHDGIVNASLEFDSVELMPTYRLRKGVPGRSYGLAIARRLGFPESLLGRAESALPSEERESGRLLETLEVQEATLAESLAEADRVRREADRLQHALQERERELKRRERDAERRGRQQTRDFLLAAREEVESAIRELREQATGAASEIERQAAARAARRRIEERAQQEADRLPPPGDDEAPAGEIAAGMRVRMAGGTEARVIEIREDRALVEAGGMRLQVPVADLTAAAKSGGGTGKSGPAARPQVNRGGWSGPNIQASSELDLRGVRVEEMDRLLEIALDAAILADLPSLRIIHGKGTGALREAVAERLRADRRVQTFRLGGLGEGGAGVTVVELG
jgi:DNA mismatch repair protein MutS2